MVIEGILRLTSLWVSWVVTEDILRLTSLWVSWMVMRGDPDRLEDSWGRGSTSREMRWLLAEIM